MSEDQLINQIKQTLLEWALEEIDENPDSDVSLEDRYFENRDSLLGVLQEQL